MKEKNLNPSTSKNPLTQKKTQLIEKAMKEKENKKKQKPILAHLFQNTKPEIAGQEFRR